MTNALLASTSTVHGSSFLEYLLDELAKLYKDASEIIFIPYARPSGITHDTYSSHVQKALKPLGKTVKGLHTFDNPKAAISNAEALFTGGGNTFKLVSQLYHLDVMQTLSETIKKGTPYLGTSAGSNIAGPNMQTTNDMPVVYPPSFKTTNVIPFNINAHFLDPNPDSTHKGETRETRIKEFHLYNDTIVIGLREGSWLRVQDSNVVLGGQLSARLFVKDKSPIEVEPQFNFTTIS